MKAIYMVLALLIAGPCSSVAQLPSARIEFEIDAAVRRAIQEELKRSKAEKDSLLILIIDANGSADPQVSQLFHIKSLSQKLDQDLMLDNEILQLRFRFRINVVANGPMEISYALYSGADYLEETRGAATPAAHARSFATAGEQHLWLNRPAALFSQSRSRIFTPFEPGKGPAASAESSSYSIVAVRL